MPGRLAKQCRERYLNNLDPELRRGTWSREVRCDERHWALGAKGPARGLCANKIDFVGVPKKGSGRSCRCCCVVDSTGRIIGRLWCPCRLPAERAGEGNIMSALALPLAEAEGLTKCVKSVKGRGMGQ